MIIEVDGKTEFKKICQEKLAYVDFDNDFLKMPRAIRSCELIQIRHPVTFVWVMFGVSPDTPLKGLINYM